MKSSHFDSRVSQDPRIRAGQLAERQMTHYLHRAFASSKQVVVMNNVRIIDPDQPEHTGKPGVCQIDHLVLHKWGMFIVESKSVTGGVRVSDDGTGGDVWQRSYRGKYAGMPSPIQQAFRQGEFLRTYLQTRREGIRDRAPVGMRTLAKVMNNSEHRGFKHMPVQVIVAISDSGRIKRVKGWKEPVKPFSTFVTKADLVPGKILSEIKKHKASSSITGESQGDYGMWSIKSGEVDRLVQFLGESNRVSETETGSKGNGSSECHEPSHAVNAPTAVSEEGKQSGDPKQVCSSCQGSNLAGRWGGSRYFWECRDCHHETDMPVSCSICGLVGEHGKGVRIRKQGPKYYRKCESCAIEELIWVQR